MTAAATRTDTGLRNNAIGLREVLFQSITDMAPAAAVAASIPTGVAFAGGALPLSVLIAMVACRQQHGGHQRAVAGADRGVVGGLGRRLTHGVHRRRRYPDRAGRTLSGACERPA